MEQGVGAHWEVWMMQMAGMKPLEALRPATLSGAAALGLDKEIGSIEPGKLADLVVLDRNPLENIQNSESIRYVVKSGNVWESETLNQVWPVKKEMPAFYWAGGVAARSSRSRVRDMRLDVSDNATFIDIGGGTTEETIKHESTGILVPLRYDPYRT